jgi:hypothetical protein
VVILQDRKAIWRNLHIHKRNFRFSSEFKHCNSGREFLKSYRFLKLCYSRPCTWELRLPTMIFVTTQFIAIFPRTRKHVHLEFHSKSHRDQYWCGKIPGPVWKSTCLQIVKSHVFAFFAKWLIREGNPGDRILSICHVISFLLHRIALKQRLWTAMWGNHVEIID